MASPLARHFDGVIAQLGRLDFTPLHLGFLADLEAPNLITHVKSLVMPCFLHFNFDTLLVVGYIGGQHLAVHPDILTISWN
mgnify:CR=1 FL=1